MSAQAYFEQAVAALTRVAESEREKITAAAEMLVAAICGDRSIFSFGATHSFILTEELVYRTGGLMLVNPIYPHGMNLSVRPMTATSRLERLPGLGAELLAGEGLVGGVDVVGFGTEADQQRLGRRRGLQCHDDRD